MTEEPRPRAKTPTPAPSQAGGSPYSPLLWVVGMFITLLVAEMLAETVISASQGLAQIIGSSHNNPFWNPAQQGGMLLGALVRLLIVGLFICLAAKPKNRSGGLLFENWGSAFFMAWLAYEVLHYAVFGGIGYLQGQDFIACKAMATSTAACFVDTKYQIARIFLGMLVGAAFFGVLDMLVRPANGGSTLVQSAAIGAIITLFEFGGIFAFSYLGMYQLTASGGLPAMLLPLIFALLSAVAMTAGLALWRGMRIRSASDALSGTASSGAQLRF